MKNSIGYSVLGMICMSIAFITPGKIACQTENSDQAETGAIMSGELKAVSARIASMYNADVETVERYLQAAVNLESRVGIAAPVVIAIAIHESSFKSALFLSSGNPFGIKASKPWVGPTFSKWHDGEETKFRVYASPEEAIWDLGNFIKSRPWYADVFDCPADDARCVIDALKKTEYELGYSMNPNWDEAIMAIIEKLGLQALATR